MKIEDILKLDPLIDDDDLYGNNYFCVIDIEELGIRRDRDYTINGMGGINSKISWKYSEIGMWYSENFDEFPYGYGLKDHNDTSYLIPHEIMIRSFVNRLDYEEMTGADILISVDRKLNIDKILD